MAQHVEREVDAVTEVLQSVSISKSQSTEGDQSDSNLCCICQEQCVNPVKLPCSHIFCFLCIKGVAARSNHCALCRQQLNLDILSNPSIINRTEIESVIQESEEYYRWYYEAKNGGWWLCEQRTSTEMEKAFQDQRDSVRLQISGFFYTIDFKNMIQYREDIPSRRRQIKRDKISAETVKGVAGIVVKDTETDVGVHDEEDRKQTVVDPEVGGDRHTDRAESEASQQSEHQTRLVTGLEPDCL